MKITESQKHVIDDLVCERLCSNPMNRVIVQNFCNKRNDGIATTLREKAWNEDTEGAIAYYVVKSAAGEVLFFFSLKCGGLHYPLDNGYGNLFEKISKILKKLSEDGADLADKDAAKLMIEKIRSGFGLSKDDVLQLLKKEKMEREIELENGNINRVGFTHSGIELVHFCENDGAKDFWKAFGMPHSLGVVVFWAKVVPIVLSVMDFIGCKYLFLFAADSSSDGRLINYYMNRLHFEIPNDIGTSKPLYDLCCKFMCQETKNLKRDAEQFFEEFNLEMV